MREKGGPMLKAILMVSVVAFLVAACSSPKQVISTPLSIATAVPTKISPTSIPTVGFTPTPFPTITPRPSPTPGVVLATADFSETTFPSSSIRIDPVDNMTVWQNTLTIGIRVVNLEGLRLRQRGNMEANDFSRFRLLVDGSQVASWSPEIGWDVHFDTSVHPVKLEPGTRVLQVVADILGGSTRNFRFALESLADMRLVDSAYGAQVTATANGSAFRPRVSGMFTINAGTVTVKAADIPDTVIREAKGVTIAKFEVWARGEPFRILDLEFWISVNKNSSMGAVPQNLRLFLNGVDVTGGANLPYILHRTAQPNIIEWKADIVSRDPQTPLRAGDVVQIMFGAGARNGIGQASGVTVSIPTADVAGEPVTIA